MFDERSSVRIAELVSDLRSGRVRILHHDPQIFDPTLALAKIPGPVVDATQIYRSLVDIPRSVYVYEDHPSIIPPWESAFISYVNEHRNVVVMHIFSRELAQNDRPARWIPTHHEVDWSRVRWITQVTVWGGGVDHTTHQAIPAMGPLHVWFHAVYDDGRPADIRWVQLQEKVPLEQWDMANLVVLGALNYLNCRNVEIVEPRRSRAETRRILRTGVRVSVINVFPVGTSVKSKSRNGGGVPLTSVRGHFSCYGPDYGKGLLFGKYSGRFWIPQHARGDRELGEIEHSYVLRPTKDRRG